MNRCLVFFSLSWLSLSSTTTWSPFLCLWRWKLSSLSKRSSLIRWVVPRVALTTPLCCEFDGLKRIVTKCSVNFNSFYSLVYIYDQLIKISLSMRRCGVGFPGRSNRTQARHHCDVSSGLCCPGANPRRWIPKLVTLFDVIPRVNEYLSFEIAKCSWKNLEFWVSLFW